MKENFENSPENILQNIAEDLSTISGTCAEIKESQLIRSLEIIFPETLVFTDNSGIKNVQFLREIDESEALNHYYDNL